MRRFLPVLAVALVGLVSWMLFFSGDEKTELTSTSSEQPVLERNDPIAAEAEGLTRTDLNPEVEAVFTNRPIKEGNGTHKLGGRVVDEAGEGVANAWVAAYSSPFAIADFVDDVEELIEQPLALSLDPLASVRTNEEGYFDLAGLPGRTLYLTARAPMRLSNGRQRVNAVDLTREDPVLIKTFEAASLEGTVRDDKGNPVPNSEVLIYPGLKYVLSALRSRDLFVERAYTDGAGKFSVEAVPAGMVLNASAFGGPTHPGTSEFGPGSRLGSLRTTVELAELGSLEGRVLSVDDEPVSNTRVAAIPLDLRMVIPVLRNIPGWITETDGGGNYSFSGLPYGQYLMVAQGDEGRSAPHTGRVIGPTDNLKDIVMDTRNEVRGRVIDSNGDAIANATVALMSLPDPEDTSGGMGGMRGNNMNFLIEMAKEALPELLPADTQATTNGQGEFRIAAWRQARVRVSAPGYVTSDYRFNRLPDDKNPVLVLQRPGGVSGRVVRAADDEPVPFFVLQPDMRGNALGNSSSGEASSSEIVAIAEAPVPEISEEKASPSPMANPRAELEATLGEDEHLIIPRSLELDGLKNTRYADDPNGEFRLAGLAPGRWQLRVRADGYETERKTIHIAEGQMTEDVEIRLGQGVILIGQVVDKRNGKPVESAMVSASDNREGGFALLAQGFMDGMPVTTSRADGSFELRGVDDGTDWVHVMATGYASANLEITKTEDGEIRENIKVEMLPGGSLTGTVTDRHGVLLPRRMVVAFSPGSQDFHQGATDEEGVYRIDNLRPGNYLLISVSLDDESLFTGDFMSILSGGRFVPAIVEEGKTSTVDIVDTSAGGCRLSGRLTSGGVPVANAMLSSLAMGGAGMFDFRMATARTDENGNFVFKSLAPGEYTLNVDSEEWSGQLDLFVDDIPEDYVELRVPETVVTGRILAAASGTAIEGVRVRMVREDSPGGMAAMFGGGGGWRTSATTDEQGVFTIEGAPSGDYHLVIEPDAFGRFNSENDELNASNASYRKTESDSFFLDEDERYEMPTIELEAAGSVRVIVVDADDKPFERGFRITGVPVNGSEEDEEDGWGWNGKGDLAGLAPGTWRVTVEARGFAQATETIEVQEAQMAEMKVVLREGVELSVRVLGSDGRPSNSARVTVYNDLDEVVHQDSGSQRNAFENFFSAGGDGTRGLGSFTPGRYRVEAVDGGRSASSFVTLQAGAAQVATVKL